MRYRGVIFLLAMVVNSTTLFAQNNGNQSPLPCSKKLELRRAERFQEFTVRVLGGDFDGCLEVRKGEQLVFSKRELGRLTIGNDVNGGDQSSNVYHPPVIPIGTDLTGRGKPNVIVNEWSGGAHCCFIFHVLELGTPVREVAAIRADDSDYAHFEDLNHDGKFEFVVWDFTFAYWHTGFAQSPAPRVVLRFSGTRYKLASDLMSKAPLSAEELTKKAAELKNTEWDDGYPPPELWGTMLDLIYTGNSEEAWKLVPAVWKPNGVSERQFFIDFCAQLSKSRYFSELRSTIENPPCHFNRKSRDQSSN